MATESSDPRVGLIVRIGILSIATLIGTHAALTAYFDKMAKAEEYKKIGSLSPDALLSLRADEKQRLSSGAMPIDKSMQLLATKGRMGASPEIVPSASKDVAPLEGWIQMPATVPAAMSAAAAAAAPPAPSASAASSAAPSGSAAPAASGSAAPATSAAPSAAPSGAASAPAPGNHPPRHP